MVTGIIVFGVLAVAVILAVKSRGKEKFPEVRGVRDTDGNGKNR